MYGGIAALISGTALFPHRFDRRLYAHECSILSFASSKQGELGGDHTLCLDVLPVAHREAIQWRPLGTTILGITNWFTVLLGSYLFLRRVEQYKSSLSR